MEVSDDLIIESMQQFGGGFIKALVQLWQHADANNKHRIRLAFDDYFEQYKRFVPVLPKQE